MEEPIASLKNPRIKHVVKLQRQKYRCTHRQLLVEGVRLVEEALHKNYLQELFFSPQRLHSHRGRELLASARDAGVRVWSCSEHVLDKAGATQTSPGVLGVAGLPEPGQLADLTAPDAFVVWADGIKDPGNLGTMIRTAAAAGAGAVLLSPETVDPFGTKVVRASMGAVFSIPLVFASRHELSRELKRFGFLRTAAALSQGKPYYQADLSKRVALIIGSESVGPDPAVMAAVDQRLTIPMAAGVESLNAAIAAAILLYECRRQREDNAAAGNQGRC